MQRFLAGAIAVLLVAGAAAVAVVTRPDGVRSVPVDEAELRPGQTEATGILVSLRAAPTVPVEPLTLPVTIHGGGATITNALVGGKRSTIAWDGGRPLVLAGAGTLDLGGVAAEVRAGSVRWLLDGEPRAFAPGTYRINTPVAVGTSGLATPRQSVEFTADTTTAIVTSGNARIDVPLAAPLTLEGPGVVRLEGDLRVRSPDDDGRPQPATSHEGAYRVTLTPSAEGLRVTALFQRG